MLVNILFFATGVIACLIFGGLYLVWLGEESTKAKHVGFFRWLIGGKR